MNRLLKLRGIEMKLTPHSFKRTHISMITDAGTKLSTIRKKCAYRPGYSLKILYTYDRKDEYYLH